MSSLHINLSSEQHVTHSLTLTPCVACYNRYMESNLLLDVKIIHWIDRTDLFKISNLVLGGEATVTDLCSSLEG
jgi:hypothetical protein